jgi:hypothetical protein
MNDLVMKSEQPFESQGLRLLRELFTTYGKRIFNMQDIKSTSQLRGHSMFNNKAL